MQITILSLFSRHAVVRCFIILRCLAQEVQRISSHKSALLEKVALPENAGALSTIQKLNELMVLQGRRLVAEFHHADTSHSGGVSGKLHRSIHEERSRVYLTPSIPPQQGAFADTVEFELAGTKHQYRSFVERLHST